MHGDGLTAVSGEGLEMVETHVILSEADDRHSDTECKCGHRLAFHLWGATILDDYPQTWQKQRCSECRCKKFKPIPAARAERPS